MNLLGLCHYAPCLSNPSLKRSPTSHFWECQVLGAGKARWGKQRDCVYCFLQLWMAEFSTPRSGCLSCLSLPFFCLTQLCPPWHCFRPFFFLCFFPSWDLSGSFFLYLLVCFLFIPSSLSGDSPWVSVSLGLSEYQILNLPPPTKKILNPLSGHLQGKKALGSLTLRPPSPSQVPGSLLWGGSVGATGDAG